MTQLFGASGLYVLRMMLHHVPPREPKLFDGAAAVEAIAPLKEHQPVAAFVVHRAALPSACCDTWGEGKGGTANGEPVAFAAAKPQKGSFANPRRSRGAGVRAVAAAQPPSPPSPFTPASRARRPQARQGQNQTHLCIWCGSPSRRQDTAPGHHVSLAATQGGIARVRGRACP